jgi:hypothetical protein
MHMIEKQDSITVVREERKMLNVRKETWERLQSFGKFRESTDDLLNRLMDNMTTMTTAKGSKK